MAIGTTSDSRPRPGQLGVRLRFAALRARVARLGAGRAGATVLLVRMGGAVVAYAAQITAARMLGTDGFGIYALALVWLTLLGHLSTFGTNQAICRCVASALATDDLPAVRGFLRFGLLFVMATGAVVGGLVAAVVSLAPGLADGPFLWPVLLAAAAVPLLALQDNLEAIARAFDRPVLGIAPPYLVRNGAVLCLFGVLAASGVAPGPIVAVLAAIGGLVIGIAVQTVLLLGPVRRRVSAGPARYDIRHWLRIALPVAVVDATEILLANADVLLLGFFCPPGEVAAYFAASRLALMLDYVRYAGSAATAQRFAALAATGRRVELGRLVGQVTLATSALCLVGALSLALAAPHLLGLFGRDFVLAAPVIPILAAGLLASALLGPGEDVLTMLGEEKICAAIFAGVLMLNIGLAFLLLPAFGILGAAAATAISAATRSALLALVAFLRLGMPIPVGLSWRTARAP